MTTTAPRDLTGIRRFDDSAVQESIDRALAAVPEGKRGAVVAYVDTDKRLRLAVAARLADGWSVVGSLEHQPGQAQLLKGGAAVRRVW